MNYFGAFLLCIFLSCVILTSSSSSQELYSQGVQLCEDGHCIAALVPLRQAIDADPTSADYLNGLGVALLRSKRYDEAEHYFSKALHMTPHHPSALENIAQLEHIKHQLALFKATKERQPRHLLMCPLQYRWEDLHDTLQVKKKGILMKPFVVRSPKPVKPFKLDSKTNNAQNAKSNADGYKFKAKNATIKAYSVRKEAFSQLTDLSKRYGHSVVDYYPYGMTHSAVRPYFLTMAESLSYLSDKELFNYKSRYFVPKHEKEWQLMRNNHTGQYLQWNLDHDSWHQVLSDANFHVPEALDDRTFFADCMPNVSQRSEFFRSTHWKMLLIGEQNAGMFHHQDTLRTASWQLQLAGSKEWHLCSPRQSSLLYEAGVADTFHPDYSQHSALRQARCFFFEVHPGDLMYYPSDYWHQTQVSSSTSLSVSLSSSSVDEASRDLVLEQLRLECSGRKAIFSPNSALCANVEKCFASHQELT